MDVMKKIIMVGLFLIVANSFSRLHSADNSKFSYAVSTIKNGGQELFIGKKLPDGSFKDPVIHPAITALAVGGAVYVVGMKKWNECLNVLDRKTFLLGHKYPFMGDLFSNNDSVERLCIAYVATNCLVSASTMGLTWGTIKLLRPC